MSNKFQVLKFLTFTAVILIMGITGIFLKFYLLDSKLSQEVFGSEEISVCGGALEYGIRKPQSYLNKTGEILFKNNCSPCHAIHEVVVGPALENITERRKTDWIHRFVQNSTAFIMAGDPEAVRIFNEYQQQQMPSFALTTAEIDSIIHYIDAFSTGNSEVLFPVE